MADKKVMAENIKLPDACTTDDGKLFMPDHEWKLMVDIGMAMRAWTMAKGQGRYELRTIVRYEGGENAIMEMIEVFPLNGDAKIEA